MPGENRKEIEIEVDDGMVQGPAIEEASDEDIFNIYTEGIDDIPEEEPVEDENSKALKEKDETIARLQEQANANTTMLKGFEMLGNKLENIDKKDTTPPPQPVMTPEERAKREAEWKESIIDDPIKTMDAFLADRLNPVLSKFNSDLQNTSRILSKTSLMNNPTYAKVLNDYSDEVEKVAMSLPAGPDAYENACKQVAFNHLSDIVSAEVQKITSANTEQTQLPPPKGYTGTVNAGAQVNKPAGRKVVLTVEQKRQMEQELRTTYSLLPRELGQRKFLEKIGKL